MQVDHKQIEIHYPGLKFSSDNNCLRGFLDVDNDDRYWIKIISFQNESSFPKVFEVDERIPRKLDRHINSVNSLCFTTEAQSQIYLQTSITKVSTFISQIITPYLRHNSYYEIKRKYRVEYSHPPMGIIEGYQDILGIKNIRDIVNIMISRLNRKKLRLHDVCYCGKDILKKCPDGHEKAYRDFRLININTLKRDLEFYFFPVIEYLNDNKPHQFNF